MTAWPASRRAVLGLALAFAVAAAVRLDRLSLEELTTDEAFSWRMTTYAPAEIVARTATDVHPPLYYLVLDAWTALGGDSPAALRGLSLLFGLAAVGLAYLLYVEVDRFAEASTGRAGGLAAALLVGLHADQVEHSRHVRMYGLGVMLAALTAWLLLRALRRERGTALGWAAYAVAAAALCYTHYYGAFTIAAQLAAAALFLAQRWRASRVRPRAAAGLLAAAVSAAVLFAPWLSVLRRQTARVSGDYWIHEAGSFDVAGALVRWATGLEWTPPWPGVAIAAFAAAFLWAIARGDRGQRFLALQAGLPWVGALGLSWIAGRTLFLERYLFFSQLALLVGLARAWARLSPWPRRATAAVFGALVVIGLVDEIGLRPVSPSSAQDGARLLARSVAAGDLVLANAPRDLNVVRYYLNRENADQIEMKTPASRSVGHLSQVSSITSGEIVEEERVWTGPWPRVWRVRVHPPRKWRPDSPPVDWVPVFTRVFEGPAATRLLIVEYQRVTPGPPAIPHTR
ncbi:MAG TPA: glycosyltransferase family 39 protein [Vicinamibacteria bacterium]|nr:glycosyltransferase family 39 protein [Vicinamibacteria bacterium]